MEEMSLQEVDQVNGGIWRSLASAVLQWSAKQVLEGNVDFAGYVADNPNYWVGA